VRTGAREGPFGRQKKGGEELQQGPRGVVEAQHGAGRGGGPLCGDERTCA
jgi:hypothetical protein